MLEITNIEVLVDQGERRILNVEAKNERGETWAHSVVEITTGGVTRLFFPKNHAPAWVTEEALLAA